MTFTSNKINGNGGIGVRVNSYAAPRFFSNEFNNNFFGVYVDNYSSPTFGEQIGNSIGGNKFLNNTGTPLVVYGSTPFLGLNTNAAVMGGFNCFNTNSNCYVMPA